MDRRAQQASLRRRRYRGVRVAPGQAVQTPGGFVRVADIAECDATQEVRCAGGRGENPSSARKIASHSIGLAFERALRLLSKGSGTSSPLLWESSFESKERELNLHWYHFKWPEVVYDIDVEPGHRISVDVDGTEVAELNFPFEVLNNRGLL